MHHYRHGHATPRVLVIEDEGLIATVVAETLTDEGYEVRATSDGRDALDLVRGGCRASSCSTS